MGDLNNRNLLLIVLEARKSKIDVPFGLSSEEGFFPVLRDHMLTVSSNGGERQSSGLFWF